jgi:hypothetical protein
MRADRLEAVLGAFLETDQRITSADGRQMDGVAVGIGPVVRGLAA